MEDKDIRENLDNAFKNPEVINTNARTSIIIPQYDNREDYEPREEQPMVSARIFLQRLAWGILTVIVFILFFIFFGVAVLAAAILFLIVIIPAILLSRSKISVKRYRGDDL